MTTHPADQGTFRGAGQQDLDALPTVLDLPSAAELLGIGRTMAYQLVRGGVWPTPLIRIGRLIRVPTAPLRHLLEGGPDSPNG